MSWILICFPDKTGLSQTQTLILHYWGLTYKKVIESDGGKHLKEKSNGRYVTSVGGRWWYMNGGDGCRRRENRLIKRRRKKSLLFLSSLPISFPHTGRPLKESLSLSRTFSIQRRRRQVKPKPFPFLSYTLTLSFFSFSFCCGFCVSLKKVSVFLLLRWSFPISHRSFGGFILSSRNLDTPHLLVSIWEKKMFTLRLGLCEFVYRFSEMNAL